MLGRPVRVSIGVNDEVVAILVHVDDIKFAATKETADSVVEDLNKRLPTKHLGGGLGSCSGAREGVRYSLSHRTA